MTATELRFKDLMKWPVESLRRRRKFGESMLEAFSDLGSFGPKATMLWIDDFLITVVLAIKEE